VRREEGEDGPAGAAGPQCPASSGRVQYSPGEENGPGLDVANQEDEGTVDRQLDIRRRGTCGAYDHRGGSGARRAGSVVVVVVTTRLSIGSVDIGRWSSFNLRRKLTP